MTKRIPGAKRGRPAKSKLPKPLRGRGRPSSRVPLHQHPQRYAVALVASMAMVTESERSGALLYLLYAIDKKGELDQRAIDRLRKLLASFQTPADLAWRDTMAEAIFIATMVGPMRPRLAINATLRRAASVGEAAWARRILLPPLIKRCSLSPTSPAREDWADRLMVRWYSQARQRPKSRDAA